jgi:hypothetical protein
VDGQVLPGLPAGSRKTTCSICQTAINGAESVVTCPRCEQAYHSECWAEVGGCGTYGCENAPTQEKEPASGPPLSAWGDEKACPACGETIKAIALRCRYCGTNFDTVDPLTLGDLRSKALRDETARTFRTTVVVLFVLSLIGILAPIIAVVALATLMPKRDQLAKAGPLFQVMAYSAIGLSVVYSALIVLFLVF